VQGAFHEKTPRIVAVLRQRSAIERVVVRIVRMRMLRIEPVEW